MVVKVGGNGRSGLVGELCALTVHFLYYSERLVSIARKYYYDKWIDAVGGSREKWREVRMSLVFLVRFHDVGWKCY